MFILKHITNSKPYRLYANSSPKGALSNRGSYWNNFKRERERERELRFTFYVNSI